MTLFVPVYWFASYRIVSTIKSLSIAGEKIYMELMTKSKKHYFFTCLANHAKCGKINVLTIKLKFM